MGVNEQGDPSLGRQPGADVGDDGDVPEDPLLAPPGAGSADAGTGESVVDLPGENE